MSKGKIIQLLDNENEVNYLLPLTVSQAVRHNKNNISYYIDGSDCTVIYVSTNGDDSNDGSIEYPLKTLSKAIEYCEILSENKIVISIARGEYSLSDTITINSKKDISFVANNDVIINSLSSNVEFTLNNSIYTSTTGGHSPHWLFINGNRKRLASTPRPNYSTYRNGNANLASLGYNLTFYALNDNNEKIIYTTSQASNSTLYGKRLFCDVPITASEATMLLTDNLYQRVLIHCYAQWNSKLSSIYAIDTENLVMTLTNYNNNFDSPSITGGTKLLIENIPYPLPSFNSVDTFTIGSFYYDSLGYIHYKASATDNVLSMRYATLQTLFILNSKVKFYGITFSGTKYEWLDENGVCPDRQGAYQIEPAIKCYGDGILFYDCEFHDMEGTCIGYYNNSKNCVVDKCYFHDCGASSVRIGEDYNANTEERILPENCSILGSVITKMGDILEQSCGIIMFFSKNCHIRHNDISLCYYTGISAGYHWEGGSILHDDINREIYGGDISYNKVHFICGGLLQDFGCIYTLGNGNGLKIQGNILSYAYSTNWLAFGIYADGTTQNMIFRDNITYKCSNGFFSNDKDKGNQWIHNIATNVDRAFINGQYNMNNIIKDNIFSQSSTTVLNKYIPSDIVENNLWYSSQGTLDISLYDPKGFVGNPNFFNPLQENFTFTNRDNANLINWIDNTYTVGVLSDKMINILNAYLQEFTVWKSLY